MDTMYNVFVRDSANARRQIQVHPEWSLRRFFEMAAVQTREPITRILVGLKEYSLERHGTQRLKNLGIISNIEVTLLVAFESGY
ncbi:hypothetical protein SteCoe_38300 [Stentor coeruleus]|uniref:Uncharacterized protein n=1 Tax=Stentor coeruleus TaxID=5963 RepID=A0A1R2ALM2_9CILI|nr:hypothetical protein SteCoe_38300 [Stentor coeruleus]